ncbi:MAG TPA: zinc ribbon domain-containing protein [Thermosulfurimonas dismutans]|uniref:Zinc ribbon domain-containing protein n=1 Tax=Thermosulfurimonas dismutans TaxID=999894 RepID=A0A7C3GTA8_9BACT|nr:zinc ribbon domain-containing protein [Thermosulfurimonas sp.]HFC97243.1 zinc ribbon domain-containing protein [Thermosulfurimonas dismutans]
MPIYEFRCEVCGEIFERLMKMGEEFPPCPRCGESRVLKLPSLFGFQDAADFRAERERAILKRARDYLIDGKVGEARRFLSRAQEYVRTDRIRKLHDQLSQRKPVSGGYVSRTEVIIKKKK